MSKLNKKNEKNNDNKITPCIDTVDTKDKVYVYMDIPGVLNSSVDINFFENKVCIWEIKLNHTKQMH
jgi:HSP20 family molecular chaperone IbpA